MSIAELSRKTGVPYFRLYYRITHGWALDEIAAPCMDWKEAGRKGGKAYVKHGRYVRA